MPELKASGNVDHGDTPTATPRVALLVDDDEDFRASLALLVEREGFQVIQVGSLEKARVTLRKRPPDVAFVDLGLPDGSGLDLLNFEDSPPGLDIVMITGNATVQAAVEALRQGATDFLTKPIDRGRLRAILSNVMRTRDLRTEVDHLRGELRDLGRFGRVVGRSPVMQQVYDRVVRVAPTRANVLIRGESGTGKELVAETIHQMSPRARARFLAVNCGAVAPNVIESELFGHEKGSFTGADRSRRGYFEEANRGTLFLDEITEMSPELQVKLLRVLETGIVMRVGASDPIQVDVRVLAATNRDPEKALRDGRLREDLYYRLNVFSLELPPLRDRGDDIELLAVHFLDAFNVREGTAKRWSPRALRGLRHYPWPGNVRELRNVVERAAILADEVLDDPGLPESAPDLPPSEGGEALRIPLGSSLAEAERKLILATLRMVGGDKKEAARRLGISLKTLYNRLNVYQAGGQVEDEPLPA